MPCFSAPPTSPDCKFAAYVHFVNRKPVIWVVVHAILDENVPRSISFPTLCDDGDVYALEAEGRLDVYRSTDEAGRWFWEVVAEAPRGCSPEAQCFLVKCEENRLLLVQVHEYGESVEVYKLNQSSQDWEKIDGLGRCMIYICGATCICKEAKAPEMENKIYFPRLHSKNGKIVFYSLETCKFHTFNGRKFEEESFEGFLGTKYILNPHVWIEPSWSR
ncbi:uncharacterized protein LOC143622862 [Bidens hawaiensis]|uniref:uncharacterized protein LOC143622862 n=1 Tax=Bidens hawaiensis TaxID=980011 RepID=UPI00404B3478